MDLIPASSVENFSRSGCWKNKEPGLCCFLLKISFKNTKWCCASWILLLLLPHKSKMIPWVKVRAVASLPRDIQWWALLSCARSFFGLANLRVSFPTPLRQICQQHNNFKNAVHTDWRVTHPGASNFGERGLSLGVWAFLASSLWRQTPYLHLSDILARQAHFLLDGGGGPAVKSLKAKNRICFCSPYWNGRGCLGEEMTLKSQASDFRLLPRQIPGFALWSKGNAKGCEFHFQKHFEHKASIFVSGLVRWSLLVFTASWRQSSWLLASSLTLKGCHGTSGGGSEVQIPILVQSGSKHHGFKFCGAFWTYPSQRNLEGQGAIHAGCRTADKIDLIVSERISISSVENPLSLRNSNSNQFRLKKCSILSLRMLLVWVRETFLLILTKLSLILHFTSLMIVVLADAFRRRSQMSGFNTGSQKRTDCTPQVWPTFCRHYVLTPWRLQFRCQIALLVDWQVGLTIKMPEIWVHVGGLWSFKFAIFTIPQCWPSEFSNMV